MTDVGLRRTTLTLWLLFMCLNQTQAPFNRVLRGKTIILQNMWAHWVVTCMRNMVTIWHVEVKLLKADGFLRPYKMLLLLLLPMFLWPKKRSWSSRFYGKILMVLCATIIGLVQLGVSNFDNIDFWLSGDTLLPQEWFWQLWGRRRSRKGKRSRGR